MTRKITLDDIAVGDIAAEMHLHQTNSGVLKGWEMTTQPFDISKDVFDVMLSKMATPGDLVQNKYAYVVSVTEDYEFNVSSVLVIYRYDHQYYCASLLEPEWAKKLSALKE